jgi:hypothetical protein
MFYVPTPAPLEYWTNTGMVCKPSLGESGEQIMFPVRQRLHESEGDRIMNSFTCITGGTIPGFGRFVNFVQTFSVGTRGTSVLSTEYVEDGILFCLNTCNVTVDARICRINIHIAIGPTQEGFISLEHSYEPCPERGIVKVFVPLEVRLAKSSPPATAYVKYEFADW